MAEVDLGLALGVLSAIAVFAGLVFNGLQTRHAGEQRRLQAAGEIMHSFQSPDFARAAKVLLDLPEDLPAEELRRRPGVLDAIHTVGVVHETLGVLVHRRIVPLDMIQDVMGGATVGFWRKARPYVEDERVRQQRANVYEWFQWLAERLEENAGPAKAAGAQVAHKDWRP